jgi:hypothetical protein
LAILALLSARAIAAPPSCPAAEVPSLTRYCASIKILDGKAALLESALNGPLNPSFRSQLDQEFSNELNRAGRLYRLALDEKGLQDDDKGLLTDSASSQVRSFNGPYAGYLPVLESWTGADTAHRGAFDVVLTVIFPNLFVSADERTSLLFSSYDGEQGIFLFDIPAPFDAAKVQWTLKGAHVPARRQAQLIHWIPKKWNGGLWQPGPLAESLREFYDRIGLDALVTPHVKGNEVEIFESPSIARIAFPYGLPKSSGNPDWDRIDQAFYNVMDDQAYRAWVKHRDKVRNQMEIAAIPAVFYQDDLALKLPYVDRRKIQMQQLLLQSQNLTVSFLQMPGSIEQVQMLLVEAKDQPKKEDTAPAAPAVVTADGRVTASPEAVTVRRPRPIRSFAPPADPAYCDDPPRIRETENYLGGGFSYRPGQGARPMGFYQRSFRAGSLSATLARDGNNLIAPSGSFYRDFLGFGPIHRRVSIEFRGGSAVQANRVIDGALLNERRNGASGRIDIEPFRDLNGALLRFYASAGRNTVKLSNSSGTSLSTQLSTLDTGALLLWSTVDTPYTTTLRVEPVLRIAPGLGREPSFRKVQSLIQFHQLLPASYDIDITAHGGYATRRTPVFELPSLGGDNLRGFRTDDALARGIWSVQPEFWMPLTFIPHRAGSKEGQFLQKNFKLAAFVDAGATPSGSRSRGIRWAPGLGVRFLYGPVVMKLDWGYGFGERATRGSRGKFYFNFTTNLPI